MSERTICGKCRGPWPCECSPEAVPVVMMESADDELAVRIARGMARKNDPLIEKPYEPPIRDMTWQSRERFCGHFPYAYDLDTDKRIVSCRGCGTPLDPYDVLLRLANMDQRLDTRLKDLRQLEKMAQQRDVERAARRAARRHPYDPVQRASAADVCGVCRAGPGGDIHNAKVRKRRGTNGDAET